MRTEQFHIDVSGIKIDVTRKNIKNIHLAVYPPTGRVRLSTPSSVSKESIRLFIISRLGWIRKHLKNFNSQPRELEREYIQGESHYLSGKRYLLNVIEVEAKPKVDLSNKYINLYIRPGSDKAKKEEVLKEFYRERLKQEIPLLIDKWESQMGVKVKDWGVKQMKTRWGTCNTRASRIWLNLELAKKPKHCLDYVVLHEMAHLIERLHNARFKSVLDKHKPGWRNIKEELNEVVY
jgi:predicted metal-dependent hydrolase